ncbi:unnamed protein product [Caenorhabditis brenneri]
MDASEYNRTLYDQNLEYRRYIENAKIQYESSIEKLTKERNESTANALEHYNYSQLCKQELDEQNKMIEKLQKENAKFRDESVQNKNIKVELEDAEFEKMETETDRSRPGQEINSKKKVADLEQNVAQRDERVCELETHNQLLLEISVTNDTIQLQNEEIVNEKNVKIAELEESLEQYKKQLTDLQDVLDIHKDVYSALNAEKSKLSDDFNQLDAEHNSLKLKYTEAETKSRQILDDMLKAAQEELKLKNEETEKSVVHLQEECSKLKNELFQKDQLITAGKKYVESMQKKLEDQKQEYEEELTELRGKIDRRDKQIDNLVVSNWQVSEEVKQLTANNDWMRIQCEQAKALSGKCHQLSLKLNSLEEKHQRDLQRYESVIKDTEKQLDENKLMVKKLKEDNAKMEKDIKEKDLKLDDLEKKLSEYEFENAHLKQELQRLQIEFQQIKTDLESSKIENDTLNTTKSELLEVIDQLKNEIEEAASEKKDLLAKLEKLTAEHKELVDKNEKTGNEMNKLQIQIAEEKTRLEAEKSQPKMSLITTTSQGSQTEQNEEPESTSQNTSTSNFVYLAVVEKCQNDMEQLKKNHAQEIQQMKERYEDLEKENQEYNKVFEGLKAMQGKRKRSDGGEEPNVKILKPNDEF